MAINTIQPLPAPDLWRIFGRLKIRTNQEVECISVDLESRAETAKRRQPGDGAAAIHIPGAQPGELAGHAGCL